MSDSGAMGTMRAVHKHVTALAFSDSNAAMAQLSRYTDDLKRLFREKEAALQQIEQAHFNSLTLLSRAAEYRDDDTGVHMDRVGALSGLLAELDGRNSEEVRLIRLAAPMHDIGKIAIPDNVLKKPGGFTIEERRIMNNHTYYGAEILGQSDIPLFNMAAAVALTHHECWDGSGYPRQLRGTEIPWCGRVVSIIDFFDALTMQRVYRPAFSDETTLQMLLAERGKKFDPGLLDLFVSNLDRFIHLRDDINAAEREHAALLRSDATQLACDMGL
ncbi:HD-GYP domain-containing protein [Rhodoferax sp. BAB1]|uniref:HD-GYP domain-containing protein n=1 Tax=Rhodoferax sp. BAB1 TaxID=2741720 RepID=UPI001576E559|nr:HD domain-containing phosphohydrolase [Rhodoferax sp. BAB1]QKO21703.1 HD domain-containing protein [Rhodoferax sp. BAB1]